MTCATSIAGLLWQSRFVESGNFKPCNPRLGAVATYLVATRRRLRPVYRDRKDEFGTGSGPIWNLSVEGGEVLRMDHRSARGRSRLAQLASARLLDARPDACEQDRAVMAMEAARWDRARTLLQLRIRMNSDHGWLPVLPGGRVQYLRG